MEDRLPNDVTIRDIINTLRGPDEYLRRVIGNMTEVQSDLRSRQIITPQSTVFVRIGTTGEGKAPNYRIEPNPEDWLHLALAVDFAHRPDSDAQEALEAHYVAFRGVGHKRAGDWKRGELKEENWSSGRMTWDEVRELRGCLRGYKRRR